MKSNFQFLATKGAKLAPYCTYPFNQYSSCKASFCVLKRWRHIRTDINQWVIHRKSDIFSSPFLSEMIAKQKLSTNCWFHIEVGTVSFIIKQVAENREKKNYRLASTRLKNSIIHRHSPFRNCVAPVFRSSCFYTSSKVLHRCEKVTRVGLP